MIIPALRSVDKDPYIIRKSHQVSPIIEIEKFDKAYSTNIGLYIGKYDIEGAYNYLEQSGIYPSSIKIEGMVALYNFLHRQLQVPDAIIIQKGITQKVRAIVSRYFHKNQESKQREIYEKLHVEILKYYTHFIEQTHYQKKTVPLPPWIYTLKEGINPESPLIKDIQSITLP